jgi:hypothetical protein
LYRLATITDQGCESHSQILIKRYKGPELYIPSAFTPNGDGTNDVLKVFPAGIRSFDYMSVFNRFGQQLLSLKITIKAGTVLSGALNRVWALT